MKHKLFRKDRQGEGAGIVFCVHNDVMVDRREDLERPNIEGLWLEVSL